MADEQTLAAPTGDDWELIQVPETPSSPPPPSPLAAAAPDPAYSYHRHFQYRQSSTFCFKFSVNFGTPKTENGDSPSSKPDLRRNYNLPSQSPITAASPVPFHKQPQSRLFSLPPELRLKIYEDIFYIPSPKVELNKACCQRHAIASAPSVLTFLASCQRARSEAEHIFYSINNLAIHTSKLSDFCDQASLRRREFIQSCVIEAKSGAQAFTAIEKLSGMPNLRKLRIERVQSVRVLNVREWAVMLTQIKRALGRLPMLQELEIWTPEPKAPRDQLEEQRAARLEQMDAQLREVLPGAP